jgi:hypothetical protein
MVKTERATAVPRRGGRPRKPAIPGQRSALGLRVTPQVKELLDGAASANGRTQSQEAEVRIENSFRDQASVLRALELAFGIENVGVLLMLGLVMQEPVVREAADWPGNPAVAAALGISLVRVIAALGPDTAGVEVDERRVRRYLRPLQQLRDLVVTDEPPPYPLHLMAGEIIARLSLRLRERLAQLPADLSGATDAPDKGDFILAVGVPPSLEPPE